MSFLVALLALCVIILIHEIGHFSAAKLFDMKVYAFNLGMGPTLFKKRGKETVYAVKLLPIGGSVLLGEDEEQGDDPREFRNRPVWQRMIVIVAGAVFNLILGLVLCVIISATGEGFATLTVGAFGQGAVSNTGESALEIGDEIYSINKMRIISASDILYKLNNSLPKTDETGKYIEYEFVVIRDNKKVTLPNVKLASTPNEQGGVTYVRDFGVFFDENKSFSNVINYSFRSAVSQGRIIWLSLIDLIKGTYGLNDLAGPVGLVTIIGDATSRAENFAEKVSMFISLTAFLTINLGILNLLPVPALDGARLLFFAAEAIRRKPLKAQTEGMIHFIGFAALMLLMLAVTFNDIKRLIFGG